MFSTGSYATVWKVEDKGNYSVVSMSTSKKNKDGNYETDFSSQIVRFLGTAHKQASTLKERDRIKLGNCGVTITKSDDYRYFTNFLVFSFEAQDGGKNKTSTPVTAAATSDSEEDLPF